MNGSFSLPAHRRRLATLVCGFFLSSVPLVSQTEAPPPPPGGQSQSMPGAGGPHRGGSEHRVEMLQRELDLTPDQVTQVKAMMASQRAKMEALHSNTALSQQEMRTQMMALHQEEDANLRALLTPDQVTRYNAMQARMRAHMQERREDANATAPVRPPQ